MADNAHSVDPQAALSADYERFTDPETAAYLAAAENDLWDFLGYGPPIPGDDGPVCQSDTCAHREWLHVHTDGDVSP